jgi:uncharacterized protein YecE (DUF72 family)
MLSFYSRRLETVEINASFYRLPTTRTLEAWREATPPGFRFAVKASRFITHRKKLRAPKTSLRRLLAVLPALGPKLGPVLFQIPPRWRRDVSRLARFLDALPSHVAAAFEFRDRSWHHPEVYALLRERRAAFCIFDLAGFTSPFEITAPFAYVRLHGPAAKYCGSYSAAALGQWATRIESAPALRSAFVFFDNDEAGDAPENALALRALLDRARGA